MLCSCKNRSQCLSLSLLSDVIRVKIRLMTKLGAAPIILLFALVFGLATTSNAQTLTANSCSLTDVQTAITGAPRGATVNVPAGSCTWGSTLTLTKGVNLIGAGLGSTVITNGVGDGTTLQISPDATAIANEETIKVAGFTFDGNGSGYGLIGINGAPDAGTKPFKNLIITGNKIGNTGSTSGQGNTCIYNFTGQTRGVIYNNTFDKCDIVFRPMGSDTTTEWSNTAYNNFSYGNSDNLYFEDNKILYSSAYTSSDNYGGWIESGQGGRVVVRFNSWDMANISNQAELWDVHGFQNFFGTTSGQTGTMIVEYYGNTIVNGTSTNYRWINHRGSWGMYFNNTYSGGRSPDIEVNQYSGGCTSLIVPAPSDYLPIVNNSYFFNNSVNGALTAAISGSVNACGVVENVSWWNENTSFNGTTGVGYGLLSARPSTCLTGVGYWATDQGSWNSSGSGGQGVFYKCTSANTWTLYYTPYTYPHPLRTGSLTTGPPVPPTGLVVAVR